MQKTRILTVGGISSRLTVHIDSFPLDGQSVFAKKLTVTPDGDGLKTAIALSRLGLDSLLCGRIGADAEGAGILDYLESERVDARNVIRARESSTSFEMLFRGEDRGRRTIRYAGANELLSESIIDGAFSCYPDAVIIAGGISAEAAATAALLANTDALPLYISSISDKELLHAISRYRFNVISLDERDAYSCTGIRAVGEENCKRICFELSREVATDHVILRLGERGYFIFDGTYYSYITSYDPDAAKGVSTDVPFFAGLVRGMIESKGDIKRSAQLGALAAAVSASLGGGLISYPTEGLLVEFAEANGIQL